MSLQIVSGTQLGTRIQLKSGQVARFGRTEWADFAFPGDAAMADVHFELDCGPRSCTVRDLGSGQATQVNGQPVQEVPLQNGQRITAGGTTFVVAMDPPPTAPRSNSTPLADSDLPQPAATPLAVPAAPQVSLDAVQLCQKLKLDDAAARLAVPQQSGLDFAVALGAAGEHAAAMRVLAYWLPKRKAVWWGAQCLRATIPDVATSGLIAAAETWVQKPTDENGRAAQAAALAAPFDGPAHWVALAAFWSGPSLGPPDAPPLPPDDLLTSQGVTGALMLAATQPPANQAAERYHKFLTLGQDVAQKKLAWET